MEKKIKKVPKKVTKKEPKKEARSAAKAEKKKDIKKPVKKEKKKKDESYFIALLKKRDLIFTSWKIDSPTWMKKIETSKKAPSDKHFLYINISSIQNGKYKNIDSIPVNGLENNWHIFVKNEYCGKRIILSLDYCSEKGKFSDIMISDEIDIPYSVEFIQSSKDYLTEENILLELSEIKLSGLTGSENTSW